MKEYLWTLALNPANWAIAAILLIQLYKLVRPSLPVQVTETADKVSDFFSWAIPACYETVQALEKNNIVSKSSKLSVFFDKLFEESAKQKVALTAADLLKAKAIVSGIAAKDKPITGTLLESIASPILPQVQPPQK